MSREQWLKERKSGIGASEAAAIMGVSPWASPYSVWADKVKADGEPDTESEAMHWGTVLEAVVAREYRRRTGHKLMNLGRYTIQRSEAHPFMICTLDRVIDQPDNPGVLEIKTAGFNRDGEWDNAPPLHYQIQVQHQMAVTGMRWGVLAVLIGGREFRSYEIGRNEKFIAALIEKEAAFWELVQTNTPPPVDGTDATSEAIKALYPADDGTEISLPFEADIKWARRAEIKGDIKKLETECEAIDNWFKEQIKEHAIGVSENGIKYSYKTQKRAGFTVPEKEFRVLRRMKDNG